MPDCCTAVFGLLPAPELPFLQSLLIGLGISSTVLIWLVKKQTKEPFSAIIPRFFRQLFTIYPSDDTVKEMHIALKGKVTLRWKARADKQFSSRLTHSLNVYVNKLDHNIEKSKSLVFHLEKLPSHPWWEEFDIHSHERHILKSKFPKIKEEFEKVFANFSKGICKQWEKVNMVTGHSCSFPLITNGIVNTVNCNDCPTTFLVSLSTYEN